MTEQAVISGSYADFKIIKSRGVAQIVIEVPIEQAEKAIAAFGLPVGGSEIHVAVARLAVGSTDTAGHHSPDASERAKAVYQASSPGEQARARSVVYCRDPDFQAWAQCTDEAEAATFIRRKCRVNTRAAFATNAHALEQFLAMEREFKDSVRFGGGRP
jgi:hypothetical protein